MTVLSQTPTNNHKRIFFWKAAHREPYWHIRRLQCAPSSPLSLGLVAPPACPEPSLKHQQHPGYALVWVIDSSWTSVLLPEMPYFLSLFACTLTVITLRAAGSFHQANISFGVAVLQQGCYFTRCLLANQNKHTVMLGGAWPPTTPLFQVFKKLMGITSCHLLKRQL